ncbi:MULTISPECIES: prepilin-type N-terminal cleavage/methylation domain-containing protein [unclassified Leptolyngbya]|uniref:pilus assembly FimT family protein n=1 Tax=unclassified Leptolyngbya TaxID=2650499 RepID=UPI00168379AD|nr:MULTISPECIES: prepilin-type N-terminal cleavage/methylation domain-containing protein [unclassified Leptolyngbya]MBD1911294.1 prepilin-type N-terminal cleavage/methylation domain-containing protein [Leptolyngbya sp. FACHB-8]MBD2156688.1 prepilin-type N-terminal cleavage/methylation domain-containing protein [Leptolyngbya sp. FACHB-16]
MLKFQRNQSTTTAGFTLPEVLIVVVMAGILALIASPSWVSLVNNRRASSVRDEVIQVIRQAQEQAERDRQVRTVTLKTNTDPPTIQVQGQAAESLGGDGIPRNILRVRPNVTTNDTGDTVTSNGDTLTLRYNATGALDSLPLSPTIITVAVGNSRRCVEIQNLLGTIRTLEGNECPAL